MYSSLRCNPGHFLRLSPDLLDKVFTKYSTLMQFSGEDILVDRQVSFAFDPMRVLSINEWKFFQWFCLKTNTIHC